MSKQPNPDHWAYTPKLDDPSTWRLPLRTDGVLDARKVAAALGCLSPDARPTIPSGAHRAVRQKVRDAWRSLNGKNAELPAVLRKADLFAPSPLSDDGTPRGVMVALVPDEETAKAVAIEGGEPPEELHMTLLYLGDAGWMTEQDIADLPAVVRAWVAATEQGPLHCSVTGWAVFEADDPEEAPAVALIDAPGIQTKRASLVSWLAEAGYPSYNDWSYLPHVTLGYGPYLADGALPPRTAGVSFDAKDIIVCWAGQVTRVPLDGDTMGRRMDMRSGFDVSPGLYAANAYLRKSDAKRYTLSPLYVPEALDSHKEYADADALEAAVWDYMRSADFGINYEHMAGTRAGECVGIICWPYETEVEMTTGTGEVSKVKLPPGTVYQGVVWEEWAWPLVLDGKINALSMEGFAIKRPVAA